MKNGFWKKKYSLNLPYLYDYAKNYTKKSPKMRFLRSQSEDIFRDFYIRAFSATCLAIARLKAIAKLWNIPLSAVTPPPLSSSFDPLLDLLGERSGGSGHDVNAPQ